MFKIVIKQPVLKDIISTVAAIVEDDMKININPDGIRIEAVDPANVAMVFLQAKKEAFDFYEVSPMDLAMSLNTLDNYTDTKDALVSIELDEETHRLRISQGKTKYNMSLIDPNSVKAGPRIPQLDMPCEVVMAGSDLRSAVLSMMKVSDHAIIKQDESKFIISAKGDIDMAKVEFSPSELSGIKPGMSRALFSLDYLDDITKAISRGKEEKSVKIESGIDYPARISFNIGEYISVNYLIAPRVEQE